MTAQTASHDATKPTKFKKRTAFSINWMKARLLWGVISAFLLLGSIFLIYSKGLNLSVDFVGGSSTEISAPTIGVKEIRKTLRKGGLEDFTVRNFGDDALLIDTRGGNHEEATDPTRKVREILTKNYGDKVTIRRTETVGSKVGGELVRSSVYTLLFSIAAMLIYIWVRFELSFALGAVVALAHDALITVGFFAIFQFEFGLPIVAALLTIIGYSMNDTVVIFDRIRENLTLYRKANVTEIINLSVNETMSRTLITGGTTLLSLFALLIFGGEIIRPFIIAMTFGIIIGTYSSVFIACPFLTYIGVRNNFSKQTDGKKPTAESFFKA